LTLHTETPFFEDTVFQSTISSPVNSGFLQESRRAMSIWSRGAPRILYPRSEELYIEASPTVARWNAETVMDAGSLAMETVPFHFRPLNL
jgi:hypothetical protein